jgi:1,4-alpha-glucan branching enzyme
VGQSWRVNEADIDALAAARHSDPFSFMGPHLTPEGWAIRAFAPNAISVRALNRDGSPLVALERRKDDFFEGLLPKGAARPVYRVEVTRAGGVSSYEDAYAFSPALGPLDDHLLQEGTHRQLYKRLGAQVTTHEGVGGVLFAVWAPNARRVSVVGDFNDWDGRRCQMRKRYDSGLWEIFIPHLGAGAVYKYEVVGPNGELQPLKADPFGFEAELRPSTASVVAYTDDFAWTDDAYMKARAEGDARRKPMAIYECHLGSWRRGENGRWLTYDELAETLVPYVAGLGFTHIELMPVTEHPLDASWGYQPIGLFAPTRRYGSPEAFARFVDKAHAAGLAVILDWVPAHFPRDSFALAEFDGSHLYEHADPRQGAHQDWGTLIFNCGRNEVRCFLVASALAWFDRYHIDGLRVDAVASMLYLDYSRKEGEWIPNKFGGRENLEAIDFIRQANDLAHQYYPGTLMIAEESTSFAGVTKPTKDGGLGFDFKWNMGWMHDTLRYFSKDPIHRKWHQNDLTFGMLYQYAENFISVYSHDEVTHGKASMLFKMGGWHIPEKAANLRALYGFMWGWPGKKLLFMGDDFGQAHEWNHSASLDWHLRQYQDHEGVRLLVRDLNRLYASEPVLSRNDLNPQGFRWIACNDAEASVIAWLRRDPLEQEMFVVVGHYTPAIRRRHRVGVPRRGFWREVINTNSQYYGGSGLGNDGGKMTEDVASDGFSQSLLITLPPLSTTIFKWRA